MNYGEIKKTDIANGIGIRVSLFVSGCRHHCQDCFNSVTWDFGYGNEFTKDTEDELIGALSRSYVRGLTLIGGEPLEPENQPRVLEILNRVKSQLPSKDIWCYSGFTLEELLGDSRAHTEYTESILSMLDVLVDGRYMKDRRNISLRFRGSENQRIIDVQKSLAAGKAVLWEEE